MGGFQFWREILVSSMVLVGNSNGSCRPLSDNSNGAFIFAEKFNMVARMVVLFWREI